MSRIIVAIDPGRSGGIAWAWGGSRYAVKMPDNYVELARMLEESCRGATERIAYIEKVGYHVRGNAASSSVKLARNVGECCGILAALRFQINQVTPAKWEHVFIGAPTNKPKQGSYGSKAAYDAATRRYTTARKNKIKLKAQELCPHLRVTLKTADALGILLTCTGACAPVKRSAKERVANMRMLARTLSQTQRRKKDD